VAIAEHSRTLKTSQPPFLLIRRNGETIIDTANADLIDKGHRCT
jgi:hypothetical protein